MKLFSLLLGGRGRQTESVEVAACPGAAGTHVNQVQNCMAELRAQFYVSRIYVGPHHAVCIFATLVPALNSSV